MKLSDKGLLEIAEHEGIVPAPYRDSVGVWTFGIGHTASAGGIVPEHLPRGMPGDINAAIDRALAVFRRDVATYEDRVNTAIKVPLAQHQFDALVSFDFNTGGIDRARLTAAINNGEPDASRHFFGWLKPPEVRGRRTAEKRLFETGNYDANGDSIAIWKVDEDGRLRGALQTISADDLLGRMGLMSPLNLSMKQSKGSTSALQQGRKTMNGTKSFLTSKAVWGGMTALVGGGFSLAGYALSADDAVSAVGLLQGVAASFGGLLAIYGRVKASKRIG